MAINFVDSFAHKSLIVLGANNNNFLAGSRLVKYRSDLERQKEWKWTVAAWLAVLFERECQIYKTKSSELSKSISRAQKCSIIILMRAYVIFMALKDYLSVRIVQAKSWKINKKILKVISRNLRRQKAGQWLLKFVVSFVIISGADLAQSTKNIYV